LCSPSAPRWRVWFFEATHTKLPSIPKHHGLISVIAILLAFLFRLVVGLSSPFWTTDDEKQIYLIGLKFYTTRNWPYFGPDVTSSIQIPGALQGLSVGLPFAILPIPEAPYLLLNLLSFASLAFFAWYCTRRFRDIPKWVIWGWLLTAPWTLNFSTNVFNPSYVLSAAIFFFVGAIETYPFLSRGLVRQWMANVMMGFSVAWIMQFHLSWIVLLPYLALSFYFQFRSNGWSAFRGVGWFIMGALVPASLLAPTFIKYGLAAGLGGTSEAAVLNVQNLWQQANLVEGVLGRFLSFASYEVPRFIGSNTATRLAFLKAHLWLAPIVIFLTLIGILQSVGMALLWFRRSHGEKDWRAMKYFTLGTVALLYGSFLFSMKAPVSHTFYLVLPVAMMYGFYCWNDFLKKKVWRTLALIVIVSGIIFQTGLAVHNFERTSLYVDRARIQQAINSKDYRVLGERRPGSRY
jgi:hypothetical protein